MEMPFGSDSLGPGNHVLHWVHIPQAEGAISEVVRPIEKHWKIVAVYTKTTETIEMPFGELAHICAKELIR